jgi:hypothetical protein
MTRIRILEAISSRVATGAAARRRRAVDVTAPEFAGPSVLVTGASRGIGLSIADRFHSVGANVTITACNAEALEVAADEIGGIAVRYGAGRQVGRPRTSPTSFARSARSTAGCTCWYLMWASSWPTSRCSTSTWRSPAKSPRSIWYRPSARYRRRAPTHHRVYRSRSSSCHQLLAFGWRRTLGSTALPRRRWCTCPNSWRLSWPRTFGSTVSRRR